MAATITFRPDDDARLALEELTADGTPVSRAVLPRAYGVMPCGRDFVACDSHVTR
mgnify:CR=1 FL=1